MKCPLFVIMDKRTQLGEESDYGDCLKESCAWWNAGLGYCQIAIIAIQLSCIHDALDELTDKMPHAGQCTK